MSEEFDKIKFSIIIKKISDAYDNTTEFSKKADVNRTYISKIINQKLKNPPSPGILKRLAENSKGISTYDELMEICGYFTGKVKNTLVNSHYYEYANIPIFNDIEDLVEYDELKKTSNNDDYVLKDAFKHYYAKIDSQLNINNFFAYIVKNDEMMPLLSTKDICIVYRYDIPENGKTFLLEYKGDILIRKVIVNNDNIELIAMNSYYPIIRTTKDEINIIGKIIRAEIEHAFR